MRSSLRFLLSSKKSHDPSARSVQRHHVRDLQGAVGASIGKGFDVLSRQLHTLNRKGPRT